MHHRDDEPSMDHELSEFGGSFVGVSTVPDEEFGDEAELGDGEVGGELGGGRGGGEGKVS